MNMVFVPMAARSIFQDRLLPEENTFLAGYAALIEQYDLCVPLPDKLAFISQRHRHYETDHWIAFSPRHKPDDTLSGQLTFALRYEGVDLGILHALFEKINPENLADWIKSEPSSRYSRRSWFFYEWLTDKVLDVPEITTGNFVDALDPKKQYPAPLSISSRRHRVNNNLPGTRNFCPLVRRTDKLEAFQALHLKEGVKDKMGTVHPDLLARAAAFMLLKDSRASFAIEGERPTKSRMERWGRAIGQAGANPLSIEELLRLQAIVIEDSRFIKLGLRQEGGFIGIHDRITASPIPDHISARWEDLEQLMSGLLNSYQLLKKQGGDPILLATVIAFGFVYIHPFEDGNGRIHRYLIHHVLAECGFASEGLIFPVSAVILERIDEYRQVLESYSRDRLKLIEWEPTTGGNVHVLNDTIDLYRYFDATRSAEFLYDCVRETIDTTLPEELTYLEQYDTLKMAISEHFDMTNTTLDLLIRFLHQNKGALSKRAREKEFKELTEEECRTLEQIYAQICF